MWIFLFFKEILSKAKKPKMEEVKFYLLLLFSGIVTSVYDIVPTLKLKLYSSIIVHTVKNSLSK